MIRLGFVVMNINKAPIRGASETTLKRYVPFWDTRDGAEGLIKAIMRHEVNIEDPNMQGLHIVDMLYDPKTNKIFSEIVISPYVNGA